MANFPLIAWQVNAPAFTITPTVGSPVVVSTTPPKWGFDVTNTTTKIASTDSLIGYLADVIDATAFATAQAVFVYTDGTNPATSPLTAQVAYVSAGGFTLTFASADAAAVYGFDSATVTFAPAASPTIVTTGYNPAGVWVPCGVAGDVRRTTRQRAAASSSDMSGLSTDVVNWGAVADLEFLSSVFPAGNLTRWFASTQIYATAAGRDVDDPNNTLEGLLLAAATGVTFRLYRQPATTGGILPTTYVSAKLPKVATQGAAEDYSTAVDEPRLWSTAGLLFRGDV